ncbi:hypothetical protein KCG44_01995 [Pacificimonas sp. WHA3]|uniref:Lipoprotein n=1 Tax=Pacificimonas pallii TaxID=2827236 RepID=A0ABS6SC97_9SPHN|nr:hypothetical protein [Pacificimonas pallii]MBV7255551.1 hypothetical protein [Pacificimonas pallii]
MRILLALILPAALSGCLAKAVVDTAVDVATLPVKAGSKAVDLATTSASEKDEKFIRRMRKDCERWEKDREKAERKARASGDWSDIPEPPNQNCGYTR